MRKIKLVPDKPFYNICDVTVYDVTDSKERKRCKIQVEYSAADVRQLKERGMDCEAAKEYYKDWIYDLVKYYILDDWECTEGMEQIMLIVDQHIRGYFEEAEG